MRTTGTHRISRWHIVGAAVAVAAGLAPVAPGRADVAATVLAVAPDGTGDACAVARPCGLAHAQERARAAAATGAADVVVELAGGTYALRSPITFTAADSGRNGHVVRYQAAPGAQPVLSGGLPLTGWTRADAAHNVWVARVPAGTRSRELFVDGRRAQRTTSSLPGAWTQTADGYAVTGADLSTWRRQRSVELVFTQGSGFWTEPRCPVDSITRTPTGSAVKVRQPCWGNLHIDVTPSVVNDPVHGDYSDAMGGFNGISRATNPTAIENAAELLTAPGSWYLDESAGTVSYIPLPGQDMAEVAAVLPVAESLLVGAGTLAAPVHDLVLSGLTFAHTTWLRPSSDDGFPEMQSNFMLTGPNASGSRPETGLAPQGTCGYSKPKGSCPFAGWTKPAASVSFRAAERVTIEGCRFEHLGSTGLAFEYGSHDDVIRGNEVTDTGGTGIRLGDSLDPQPSFVGAGDEEIVSGNSVTDNWVHHIAAQYHGGVGIWVGYTRNTLIAHNQVDHTPYTAISFGWGGWHTDTTHPFNPTIVGGNTIEANLVWSYLETLPDGGAIYTQGPQAPFDPAGPAANPFLTASTSDAQMARGLTIRGNVALIATWAEFAYYNDEGGAYITYDHNVEYQAHALATGGCGTVGHIRYLDSYWAQPFGAYICPGPPLDLVVARHHVIPDHPGPGDIPLDLLAGAGIRAPYRGFVLAEAPEVSGVGPQATAPGGTVLVSGGGFTPGTSVWFGAVPAASVRVLSANYLVATVPAVSGPVHVTVRTPAGSSPPPAAADTDDLVVVA